MARITRQTKWNKVDTRLTLDEASEKAERLGAVRATGAEEDVDGNRGLERFRRAILRTSAPTPGNRMARRSDTSAFTTSLSMDTIGPGLASHTLFGRKFRYSGCEVLWRTEPGTQL